MSFNPVFVAELLVFRMHLTRGISMWSIPKRDGVCISDPPVSFTTGRREHPLKQSISWW
jgi:hypothetical protein